MSDDNNNGSAGDHPVEPLHAENDHGNAGNHPPVETLHNFFENLIGVGENLIGVGENLIGVGAPEEYDEYSEPSSDEPPLGALFSGKGIGSAFCGSIPRINMNLPK